jgi:AcrR family transcriptional regulator
MTGTNAGSIRARVRAEMIEEIKAVARRHLATDGANLSLRAVSRDMGMVSSALYRYFASRDDLLTALIIDAYNSLGDVAEKADGSISDRTDLRGRWFAVCHAIRGWALANPPEFALIYGSPVPGYAAPQDTVDPAARPTVVLVDLLATGVAAGRLGAGQPTSLDAAGAMPAAARAMPAAARDELESIRGTIAPMVPLDVLARGFTAWIHLFGMLTFELFGRFNNVIYERDAYFEGEMTLMADYVGM